MEQNLETFKAQISAFIHSDNENCLPNYSFTIEHLERAIPFVLDRVIQQKINQMRRTLDTSQKLTLRRRLHLLIEDIHYIDDLLQGHKQDWESGDLELLQ